tara:strand:- start:66 stop:203 length:138 start_codon:yes stop_codon:yes gene_type:complete
MLKKKEMKNLQRMKKVTPTMLKNEEEKTPKGKRFFRKKEKTVNLP